MPYLVFLFFLKKIANAWVPPNQYPLLLSKAAISHAIKSIRNQSFN